MNDSVATDPESAWEVAAATPDPELPQLTVGDLGILREVTVDRSCATVTLTPTYSGCPAVAEIAADVRHRLEAAGYRAAIRIRLAPPWTTDWITEQGRRRLSAAGIAPPSPVVRPAGPVPLTLGRPGAQPVPCPRCASCDTRRTADFGATACRALHRCLACDEPFEAVKPL